MPVQSFPQFIRASLFDLPHTLRICPDANRYFEFMSSLIEALKAGYRFAVSIPPSFPFTTHTHTHTHTQVVCSTHEHSQEYYVNVNPVAKMTARASPPPARPTLPDTFDEEHPVYANLMRRAREWNPNDRPTFDEIVATLAAADTVIHVEDVAKARTSKPRSADSKHDELMEPLLPRD